MHLLGCQAPVNGSLPGLRQAGAVDVVQGAGIIRAGSVGNADLIASGVGAQGPVSGAGSQGAEEAGPEAVAIPGGLSTILGWALAATGCNTPVKERGKHDRINQSSDAKR
jgi:hypothetical protein